MKRHSSFIPAVLGCLSIYPLLVFVLALTGLGFYLAATYLPTIRGSTEVGEAVRVRQLQPLPSLPSSRIDSEAAINFAAEPVERQARFPDQTLLPADAAQQPVEPPAASTEINSPSPSEPSMATETDSSLRGNLQPSDPTPAAVAALPTASPTIDLVFEFPYSVDDLQRRAIATPTPHSILGGVVSNLMEAFDGFDDAPAVSRRAKLPTLTATPTGTSTPLPTTTPTATSTPTETPLPTSTPPPTVTPTFTATPLPSSTPIPLPPTPVPPPTETPLPLPTPEPEYDFLLGEFFNSPTTNPFLVMYVAIVDTNEIPIGDMKIVGTRLDHNLTYESPLSTWHFEGYNAPGEVIKSGNVKFEPPGGIEDVDWIIYLADANGNRLSADVPFHTDPNDKQWYFVKFRRKF